MIYTVGKLLRAIHEISEPFEFKKTVIKIMDWDIHIEENLLDVLLDL